MTKLDLIAAIGGVDPQDLELSEQVRSRRRRICVRVLAAAAMIALLSTTVFAIPAIRNALFGAKTQELFLARIFLEEGKPADVRESSMDVSLDVHMDPSAPETLETCYVPMLPAEQWEPIPLIITEGSVVSFEQGVLLQWQNEAGEYVLFRQCADPSYVGDHSFDSVCTGYNAAYTVSQTELGGYTLQRIVVEPSELDEAGVHAEHPGLQKLYWSDGFYIFSMEVNYGMTDAELTSILESIQTVEDVKEYVSIRWVPAERHPEQSLHLERILFPEIPPEDVSQYFGSRDHTGEYLFGWVLGDPEDDPDALYSLSLWIAPEGRNAYYKQKWETFYIPEKTELRDVNGTEVLCYQNDIRAQILWRFDDADYTLYCFGPARINYEALLQIMESMRIVEDIDSVLTE